MAYVHCINSLNKSLVQMEPFQFTPAVLEELQEDSSMPKCEAILQFYLILAFALPLKLFCVQLQ